MAVVNHRAESAYRGIAIRLPVEATETRGSPDATCDWHDERDRRAKSSGCLKLVESGLLSNPIG